MTSTRGQVERNIASLMNLCSDLNRPIVTRYLRKKQKDGNATSSQRNVLYVLTFYDAVFPGRSLLTLTSGEVEDAVVAYADGWGRAEPGELRPLAALPESRLTEGKEILRSPSLAPGEARSGTSVKAFLTQSRAFFRWAKGGELPRAYFEALTRRTSKAKEPVPLTPEEFAALLEAARSKTYARRLPLNHALLWLLWDGGLRVGEALVHKADGCVRVRHYHRAADGSAKLEVDGKTGPRTVDLFESVPALDAWIAQHPNPNDPEAPLFPNDRDESRPMPETSVNVTLDRLSVEAGIRHVNPHLFRHTAASRAAEANWSEAKMRRRFGWSNSSKMPGHYSHLRGESIADQIRKDANVDELGRMVREDPTKVLTDAITESQTRLLRTLGLLPKTRLDDDGSAAAAIVG